MEGFLRDERRFAVKNIPIIGKVLSIIGIFGVFALIAAYYSARGWAIDGSVPLALLDVLNLHV